jgi:hypothetical protein
MALLHAINWLYVASGFGVGFLVGLTGVGGGSLMTPILVLLFGIHPATAVGTDLLYASVTKTGGSFVHSLNKTLDWKVVLRLGCGSVPASILTLILLNYFDIKSSGTNAFITKVLAVALLFTSVALFVRPLLKSYAERASDLSPALTRNLTVVTGAILGILVTISSVGAGAIGMTALILLYPKLPMVRLVGSDIAHAVPLTLVAGAGHWLLGSPDLAMLGSLLIGSLPGIVIASSIAPRASEDVLRHLLAAVLLLVAWRLLASA